MGLRLVVYLSSNGLRALALEVSRLSDQPELYEVVECRLSEFKEAGRMGSRRWFEELVFCLLTAFSSAQSGLRCVAALGEKDLLAGGSQGEIAQCLKDSGYRFPNKRAEYIFEARRLAPSLKEKVVAAGDSKEARAWLVENVRGLGWKEASHFLRNVGFFDVAIVDRHIMGVLRDYGLVDLDPERGVSKKRYLQVEGVLEGLAMELGMSLGELDLYLWYMKTGQILK